MTRFCLYFWERKKLTIFLHHILLLIQFIIQKYLDIPCFAVGVPVIRDEEDED